MLGGLASSRLDQILVRDEKIATEVSADMQPFHRVGFMEIDATVKPGVDPKLVEKRLDEVVADYIKDGPTADELERATPYDGSAEEAEEHRAIGHDYAADGLVEAERTGAASHAELCRAMELVSRPVGQAEASLPESGSCSWHRTSPAAWSSAPFR